MATIAIAAYGTSNYQPIFNANRNDDLRTRQTLWSRAWSLLCRVKTAACQTAKAAQDLIAAEEAACTPMSSVSKRVRTADQNRDRRQLCPFCRRIDLNGRRLSMYTSWLRRPCNRGGNATREFSASFRKRLELSPGYPLAAGCV